VSVNKTKYCNTHTKEKEDSGVCCQMNIIPKLVLENSTKIYSELEQMKKQNKNNCN